jgi:hypothetical protein
MRYTLLSFTMADGLRTLRSSQLTNDLLTGQLKVCLALGNKIGLILSVFMKSTSAQFGLDSWAAMLLQVRNTINTSKRINCFINLGSNYFEALSM